MININVSEIFAISIIVSIYMAIAIVVKGNIEVDLHYDACAIFSQDKIVSNDNIVFAEGNKNAIAWACGMLWLFFAVFKIWSEFGDYVYEKNIVKDEEDRIVSWLF